MSRVRAIVRSSSFIAPIVLATSLAVVLPAVDAAAQGAADEPFEDRSLVTLVEVPVNVVDRDGKPIRGLTKEDFELRDKGRKQEIAGVEVVDLNLLGAEHLSKKEARRRAAELPSVARRHFLLLFDLTFSQPKNILKAREAAREFILDHLHPTDLAGVATFSMEKGPQLVLTFTPDRAQIARAVDTLGIGNNLVDPLRFMIDDPTRANESSTSDMGLDPESNIGQHLDVIRFQQERARKNYQRQRISGWAKALSDTARALASIDGRKHVIYFSEGFDGSLLLGRDASRPSGADDRRAQRIRESNALWLIDQDETFGNRGLQGDVADMLESFRRADCTIQAVDIAGLRVDASVDGMSSNVVSGSLNDAQDALFYVADGTGGTLFEDANDLGVQLSRVLERNSVTYILRFYPSRLELDGSYHRLKVDADLPRGARLSHRAGYYAPRSYDELHPLEKALLASEAIASAAPREELELNVLAAPFRANDAMAYVPVILEMPGGPLLAGHTKSSMSLEIYVYATNSKGEMRDFFTQVVGLDLTTYRQALYDSGVKYYGHLDLPPDDYLVRVLVRNGETGRTAVATREVEIPDYTTSQATTLLPPLFMEPPNQWIMVREQADAAAGEVVYPFMIAGEPFIPAAEPALGGGQIVRFALMAYGLGDGSLTLEGQIRGGRDEAATAIDGLALIERTEGAGVDTLLASFDPRGLAAGEYTLEVAITESATGVRHSSSIPIRVR